MSTLGTLQVKLVADVNDFTADMGNARQSFATTAERFASAGQALNNTAMNMAPISLVLGGIAVAAVSTAATFEQQMNVLQASTGATDTEMEALRATATALGADISLPAASAVDASVAMLELSRAGLSTRDTMDAARGVLLLVAAGETDVATAAGLTASALNAFGMAGEDASDVADLLAAAANESQASVESLGLGLQAASAVFAQAGMSVNDLVTALALMANKGIAGSDAGTSLKTMLLSLLAPTDKAAELMASLGITIWDASGSMLPMPAIIESFNNGLYGMTQAQQAAALSTIFGSDAIRAANVLLGEGASGWNTMSAAVSSGGSAQAMAAAQTSGFAGAMSGLKSTVETFLLTAGTPFLNVLQQVVTWLSGVVSALMTMDPQVLTTISIIVALIAAITPVVMMFGMLATALGALLSPVGLVIVAIMALIAAGIYLYMHWDEIKAKAIEVWNGIKAAVETAVNNLRIALELAWAGIKASVELAMLGLRVSVETAWNTLRTNVETVVNGLKASIELAWAGIKASVELAMLGLRVSVETAWNTLRTNVEMAVNGLKTSIETAWNTLKANIETTVSNLKINVETEWNAFKMNLETSTTTMRNNLETEWNTFKTNFSTTTTTLKQQMEMTWSELKTNLEMATNFLKTNLVTIWTELKTSIETRTTELQANVRTKWQEMKTGAINLWTMLKSNVEQIVTVLKNNIITKVTNLKATLRDAWKDAKETAIRLWTQLKDEVLRILNGMAGSCFEAGRALAQRFGAGIEAALRAALEVARRLAEELRNLLPGSDAKEGPLSDLLASGKALPETLAKGISASTNVALGAMQSLTRGLYNALVIDDIKMIGASWIEYLVAGIEHATPRLQSALERVNDLVPASMATKDVVGAIESWGDAFAGTGARGANGSGVVVNISGPWHVRADDDIRLIADAVGEYLARQGSVNARLGRT